MLTKTYGVYGFIEYEVALNIGGKSVKVTFANGSISQQGILPATYTTNSRVVQYCIERLRSFRNGRIRLIRSMGQEDQPKPQPKPKSQPQPKHEDACAEGESEQPTGEEAPAEGSAKQTLTRIEVTCLQDAQNYMTEHFGIPAYKVRTRAQAQAAGAEHGVEFGGL